MHLMTRKPLKLTIAAIYKFATFAKCNLQNGQLRGRLSYCLKTWATKISWVTTVEKWKHSFELGPYLLENLAKPKNEPEVCLFLQIKDTRIEIWPCMFKMNFWVNCYLKIEFLVLLNKNVIPVSIARVRPFFKFFSGSTLCW